ncbi:MAG: nicotinamide-nucleotide adenylyltransferase [Candidatus Ranarchaeia archaeon]
MERKRGLIIGRFQPLHKGHIEIIKKILPQVDELIIGIGSAQYGLEKANPFTSGERMLMLKESMKELEIDPEKYWIIPIPDINNNALWVSHVISFCPKFSVVFSNNPLVKQLFTNRGFSVKSIDFVKRRLYNSTKVRKRLGDGKNWEELVPTSIVEILKNIKAEQRLNDLLSNDMK